MFKGGGNVFSAFVLINAYLQELVVKKREVLDSLDAELRGKFL